MKIGEAERRAESRRIAYGEGAGTHIPLLASVLAIARPGPVLELGTGPCSSPLIAEMCRAMGRAWDAADSSWEWVESVGDLGAHGGGFYAPGYNALPVCKDSWSVVFIDTSPASSRRRLVEMVRSRAEFIVVHDTDNQGRDLDDLLAYFDTFPHRYDYTVMRPWTTVVSDLRAYPGARP